MSGANVTNSIAVLLGNVGVAIVVALLGLYAKNQKPVT